MRIQFARILYRKDSNNLSNRNNIFLFDDPLSSVDIYVGKHMFINGIYNYLLNKKQNNNNTCLMVINSHLPLLKYFDEVIIMINGEIKLYENIKNLFDRNNMDLYNKYKHLLPDINIFHNNEEDHDDNDHKGNILRKKRYVTVSVEEYIDYIKKVINGFYHNNTLIKQELKLCKKKKIFMGSQFEIAAIHTNEEFALGVIDSVEKEIIRIENLISSWNTESQTSLININAGITPVFVDKELFSLIKRAKKLEKKDKIKKANKRYEKALEYLIKSNKEKPNQPDTLNYLGFATRKLGDYEKGEEYYLLGLKFDPDHKGINEYLGELYVVTNRIDLATKRLNVLKNCNCEEYEELKELIEKN